MCQLRASFTSFGQLLRCAHKRIVNMKAYIERIIIIMAGMAVFNVAGYLIEERRRWPVITASPRGQCSK